MRIRALTIDEVAPNASQADMEAARRLLAAAGGYGDRYWTLRHHPDPEMVVKSEEMVSAMSEDHPGFVDSTYGIVLSLGTYLAR